jgi:type IV pilus assembly protein PilB
MGVREKPATPINPDNQKGRSRLGEILIANGTITQAELDHALGQQKELKLPLGKTLLKLNYLSDETMRQALSLQLNVPYLDLEKVVIDRQLTRVISRSYARRYSLLPIAQVGRTLTVAMDDPTAAAVVEELTRLTNHTITIVTASSHAIQQALRRLYEEGDEAPAAEAAARKPDTAADGGRAAMPDGQQTRRADELFHQILTQALESRCSDIHLEMLPAGLQVRFRIDGVLRRHDFGALQRTLDKSAREIVSRIKILCKLDIAERRRPQDGSFQIAPATGSSLTIDLRVSTMPSYTGESVVIRILDRTRAPKSLGELDLSPLVLARFDDILKHPTGMFLVTGPTGSGKSTTLYSMLMKLQRPEIRILTAEDPVEYVYPDLSQFEVNEDIGNTFAHFLRAFLRHDPEVIMVGEIRDEPTAEMAFRAAQTGHFLLSTMHTNSAIAALPRLLDLKIEPSLIASSLIGVMSQRLIRRICTVCREPHTPPAQLVADFFPAVPPGLTFYTGRGCAACGQTGYKGRMVVADLWLPDDQDLGLIMRHAPLDDIRRSARRTTLSMAQDAFDRLAAGRTTLEEVLRVLPYEVVSEIKSARSADA